MFIVDIVVKNMLSCASRRFSKAKWSS